MKDLVISDYKLSNDYIRIINTYPILSDMEESVLATKLYETGDMKSAETLVLSNLRGVLYIARQYNGYGLPYQDLVQEGMVGLMRAVKRFNPYSKVRLFIYAIPWIKAEIQSFIIKNWKLVKVATTDSKKRLFFGLRQLKNKLLPINKSDISAISAALSVKESDIRMVDSYFSESDISIDELDFDILEDKNCVHPEEYVLNMERESQVLKVSDALDILDSRSKDIIYHRFIKDPPETLSDLSNKWNISIERVRQIEMKALSSMKKALPYFDT